MVKKYAIMLGGKSENEETDQRILNVVNRYDIGTVIEYLCGISHNSQFV
jgi:hypothetical protein